MNKASTRNYFLYVFFIFFINYSQTKVSLFRESIIKFIEKKYKPKVDRKFQIYKSEIEKNQRQLSEIYKTKRNKVFEETKEELNSKIKYLENQINKIVNFYDFLYDNVNQEKSLSQYIERIESEIISNFLQSFKVFIGINSQKLDTVKNIFGLSIADDINYKIFFYTLQTNLNNQRFLNILNNLNYSQEEVKRISSSYINEIPIVRIIALLERFIQGNRNFIFREPISTDSLAHQIDIKAHIDANQFHNPHMYEELFEYGVAILHPIKILLSPFLKNNPDLTLTQVCTIILYNMRDNKFEKNYNFFQKNIDQYHILLERQLNEKLDSMPSNNDVS